MYKYKKQDFQMFFITVKLIANVKRLALTLNHHQFL